MAPASALVNKIKVQLKLAINRLRMVQQRDTAIAKQQRRDMAQLLEFGKEESARIRVENIIRSDITVELLEVLELYCELLLARAGLLEGKECDAGLVEAVHSLMYAAPRTEIRELQQLRQLLADKYGKEFALQSTTKTHVAPRVLSRLAVEPPTQELVTLYLTEIARTYGISWPDRTPREPMGLQTPPKEIGPRSPVSIAPARPTVDNPSPSIKLETDVAGEDPVVDAVKECPPNTDDLAKRFAALKRT